MSELGLEIENGVPTGVQRGRLYLIPVTLRKANDFVEAHHRHNGRTARNGGKWACGVACDGRLVGVAIVGNPLSATLMDGWTAEVLRVCTLEGAPKGACSMLYRACWRAWRAMGGRRLITYIAGLIVGILVFLGVMLLPWCVGMFVLFGKILGMFR